jgi:IMP dehydrogenase/GMP reductase
MVLKDKRKKKKPRPRRLGASKPFVPAFKTGMNRDIPMGGAGGSQNLIANLLASRQAQPSAQVIQTPDQFKLAQDIKAIRTEQADIAEEVAIQKKERKDRSDKGTTGIRKVYEKKGLTKEQAEAAATEMLKTTSNHLSLSIGFILIM